ncbi:MAG: hypothetical protein H7175_28885, partial [Burkholderiales bacterium]|nr:hypothetical protein [Anaerolineae bacterium]
VTLMGHSAEEAALVGLFLHGCQIVAASTSGLLGYFLLEWSKRSADHAETTSEQVPAHLS